MGLSDKATRISFVPPGIELPVAAAAETAPAPEAKRRRATTAPGAMMDFANYRRSELLQENDALREKTGKADELRSRLDEALADLQAWEVAKAARSLDPARIRPNRFADRHPRNFSTEEFQDLKAEIASAGSNVQPIKVRPSGDGDFEVVYGHRRLQACRELGLSVLALVDSIDDQALFVEMDRENRGRKDLSPWEQGVMYQRVLAEGLFPSNRKLAEALGIDLSALGKALTLAALPSEVVDAFASPLDIQFRWAKPLRDAFDADREGVLARVLAMRDSGEELPPKEVLQRVLSVGAEAVKPLSHADAIDSALRRKMSLHHGDSVKVLRSLDPESVDLIVTSPPYADQRKAAYGGVHADDYVAWFMPIADGLQRVLKPSGSFVLNIKERVVDGERHTYVMELIIEMRKRGWRFTEEYVWHKRNCYPGKWPNRFRDAWERCIHFTKEKHFAMYQDEVRVPMGDWKNSRLKSLSATDRTRDESAVGSGFGKKIENWVGRDLAYPTNVLHLATECSNRSHAAAFPDTLPEWFVRLFTQPGDTVLDPFSGSGTTMRVAHALGRNAIGIELRDEYCTLTARELGLIAQPGSVYVST